ncbi:uncharacterized protein LACBIDRAFT_322459 [Laccaria bicolor S238N-H82]|uniref:Predicted protein n=1 Tax=Laccaria bicolor (strain S238N-H82 / ATCC MYA-4686) TaxID=486041 RepID=B0CWD0_LACBS|nr:uncharacterized protein LACBIDRAFT_322459 [Laccaria bicolor S238N-H82]EDR13488.1 predicted protein [Laccaria bicolor S238N-H82]|eukprot:XP_001875986.1 predicted protein [Laccaria bicolor S238N-H82]
MNFSHPPLAFSLLHHQNPLNLHLLLSPPPELTFSFKKCLSISFQAIRLTFSLKKHISIAVQAIRKLHPQPQHEREDESMGSGSSRSLSCLQEGQMEVSNDDEEDSDEEGEDQGDEEWEEQEVDTGGDEKHSPGLSSDGEQHMDVDLTEGSMIESTLEHLDLTVGLTGGSMIEPTAVLAGYSMIESDLTTEISMIALEAPNLTAVSIESSIIEHALEAASLIVVELKWLPDSCSKFVACKATSVTHVWVPMRYINSLI